MYREESYEEAIARTQTLLMRYNFYDPAEITRELIEMRDRFEKEQEGRYAEALKHFRETYQ